jgi:hypothetical protein
MRSQPERAAARAASRRISRRSAGRRRATSLFSRLPRSPDVRERASRRQGSRRPKNRWTPDAAAARAGGMLCYLPVYDAKGATMPLHIKDEAATKAVRSLAEHRKITWTEAVRVACEADLARDA